MLIPIGFGQNSLSTSLGTMVYYTPEGEPWTNAETGRAGARTLIFLHGFGGGSSAYEWSKVYPAFAADHRVIAPDLIGWGRSEHPERNYRAEDYITSIVEFVEKVSDGPTTVIASALTAAFTIRAAIVRPELFKSLILTTAAGLAEFGKNYADSFFAGIVRYPVIDRLLYWSGVATAAGIQNFLEKRQFARPERVAPEMVAAYLQSARQPNAEYAALAFVRGDLCFDLSRYIAELSVPTALIWGRESEYTGPSVGRRLAALNPGAIRYFQHLDDVGFTPQLESSGVTIGLIRKYLPLLEKSPATGEGDG